MNTLCHWYYIIQEIISIFTLSDLGDLSNLIGSLPRTIQQYSPPSEWIMCELGVSLIFFRERSFKSRQNPRPDFFQGKKRLGRIQYGVFSIYCSWVLCAMDCLQLPCIRVEAVSWTQRFLTRKFWLKNRSLFVTNKFKRKCLQKFYVSSKQEKEWYKKTTS